MPVSVFLFLCFLCPGVGEEKEEGGFPASVALDEEVENKGGGKGGFLQERL